jgi:hypothetical protein
LDPPPDRGSPDPHQKWLDLGLWEAKTGPKGVPKRGQKGVLGQTPWEGGF